MAFVPSHLVVVSERMCQIPLLWTRPHFLSTFLFSATSPFKKKKRVTQGSRSEGVRSDIYSDALHDCQSGGFGGKEHTLRVLYWISKRSRVRPRVCCHLLVRYKIAFFCYVCIFTCHQVLTGHVINFMPEALGWNLSTGCNWFKLLCCEWIKGYNLSQPLIHRKSSQFCVAMAFRALHVSYVLYGTVFGW